MLGITEDSDDDENEDYSADALMSKK